jgi:hypothetical protein
MNDYQKLVQKFIKGAKSGKIEHLNHRQEIEIPLYIEGDTLFSYNHQRQIAKRVDGGFWVNMDTDHITSSQQSAMVRNAILKSGLKPLSTFIGNPNISNGGVFDYTDCILK